MSGVLPRGADRISISEATARDERRLREESTASCALLSAFPAVKAQWVKDGGISRVQNQLAQGEKSAQTRSRPLFALTLSQRHQGLAGSKSLSLELDILMESVDGCHRLRTAKHFAIFGAGD